MSLSDRTLLLSLTISCWSGQITLEEEAARAAGLDPKRDSIRHQIIPAEHLRTFQMHARKLRTYHNRKTAPWDDNGLRLIPSGQLLPYREGLKEQQAEYDAYVARHVPYLQTLIEPQYARFRDGLYKRFGSKLSIYAVPSSDMPVLKDIVDREVREALITSVQADVKTRTAEAIRQVAAPLMRGLKRRNTWQDSGTTYRVKEHEQHISLVNIFRSLAPDAPHVLTAESLQMYLDTL
jgi:hypothetical protein